MKKSWLGILIGLILINFASAYNGRFSLKYLLNWIEPSTIILAVLFLIFFAFLYFILSKIFSDKYGNVNRGLAAIVAFCISLLIVYGINRSAWDIERFFYRIDISNILTYIIILAIIIFFIWLIFRIGNPKKRKLRKKIRKLKKKFK